MTRPTLALPNGPALKLRAQGAPPRQRVSNAARANAIVPYLVALASFKRVLDRSRSVFGVTSDIFPSQWNLENVLMSGIIGTRREH